MTTLATTPRASKPKARSIKVLSRIAGKPSKISITCGKDTDEYALASEPVNDGVHVRLTKADGATYDILLAPEGNSCDCMGFTRWSHCKHVDGVFALAQREAQKPAPVCEKVIDGKLKVGCFACQDRKFIDYATDYSRGKVRCEACDQF